MLCANLRACVISSNRKYDKKMSAQHCPTISTPLPHAATTYQNWFISNLAVWICNCDKNARSVCRNTIVTWYNQASSSFHLLSSSFYFFFVVLIGWKSQALRSRAMRLSTLHLFAAQAPRYMRIRQPCSCMDGCVNAQNWLKLPLSEQRDIQNVKRSPGSAHFTSRNFFVIPYLHRISMDIGIGKLSVLNTQKTQHKKRATFAQGIAPTPGPPWRQNCAGKTKKSFLKGKILKGKNEIQIDTKQEKIIQNKLY